MVARTLLKRHPRAAVSSRHDRSVSCHPQYRAAGFKFSSRRNSISRADSPQCRLTELISPGTMWVKVLRYACWPINQLMVSNLQRTTTCQPRNCHTPIVTVASHSWNNPKALIRMSECLKLFLLYNSTRSLHYPINSIPHQVGMHQHAYRGKPSWICMIQFTIIDTKFLHKGLDILLFKFF